MIGLAAKGAALVFAASILQVSILNRISIAGGWPELLLITLVAVAFAGGAAFGAGVGFFAGLLIDTATLATLGVTSLLLTVTGYWSGRYVETTGRDKAHAPLLAVTVATVGFALFGLGLRVVLGEQTNGGAVLRSLPATLVLNLLLTPAVFALARRLLARPEATEGAPEVRLLG